MNKNVLLFSLLSVSAAASAQQKHSIDSLSKSTADSLHMLSQIVIVAHRGRYNVETNPLPIIGISKKQMEETISGNIIDALVVNAPGLNAVKTGPNISKPFIRGLGYNRVLTMYDGIRQEGQQWGDEHGIEIDGYNMQNAEVIKGPSSLLYGSDALAGVISFKPNYPNKKNDKWDGEYISEYQSNNNLVGNGGHLSYNGKHFMAAMRGSYRMAKNYRNKIDGRVYNTGFKEANASVLLGYNFNKGFVTLNGTLYNDLQGIPDGSRDSLTRQFTKQIYEGDLDNIDNRPIVSQSELNSYKLSPLHQHIQHYRIYSNFHKEINRGNVDAMFAFQQNVRREYSHPTQPDQAGMYVRLNTFNYSFRLNKYNWIPNTEVSIGSNGMAQNNKNKDATDFPIPDYNLAGGGLFAYTKWHKDRWHIAAGIRYDIRHLSWNDFYVQDDGNGFAYHVTNGDQGATKQFSNFAKNFTGISASLGATYKANSHLNIKGNIARGYRVPNITELASNGLDPGAHIIYKGNTSFSPEFSLQEDLGVEGTYSDFSYSLSLFNNNISNYIYLSMQTDSDGSALVDAQGNKTYRYEQSKAHLYGLEATLFLHPENWKGFEWENSFSVTYGVNKNPIYKGKGLEGEYLPLMPPAKLFSSLLWNIQTRHLGPISMITPKYEMTWVANQNRYLALNNTETATAGYCLQDLGVTTTVQYSKNYKFNLVLMANNIFDVAYQSNMSRLKYFEYYTQSPNGHLGIFSMGRNYSIKVLFPF